jgi:hypothetical protein
MDINLKGDLDGAEVLVHSSKKTLKTQRFILTANADEIQTLIEQN